jgi:hypothetical protein
MEVMSVVEEMTGILAACDSPSRLWFVRARIVWRWKKVS